MTEHASGKAGVLLLACRQKAGLTQRQLADAAGVSVGVVRDLEQGRTTRPHGESVLRLASALRLSQQQTRELRLAARGNVHVTSESKARGQAAELRIDVLGPLAVWRRGVPVVLGPPMQRAVLGLLALHTGTWLSRVAIIEALWDDVPPMTATSMVQSYISRLRRLLGPGGPASTADNGYRLESTACQLDLCAFGALVLGAKKAQAAGELTTACQAYADALALWQGEPLSDIHFLHDHPAVVRLNQQRTDAVTAFAEAALTAGCPDRILPQLRDLTSREPLDERAHALLMLALAGSGRQAAALGIFDQMRRRLDQELGIRPGAELIAAQAQVLNQQIPAVSFSGRVPAPGATGAVRLQPVCWPALCELPNAVAHFVGRDPELATLNKALHQHARTAAIHAIAGTAGVGKTALAIHWAYQVCDRFPDGQLFVNLRGYDPDQPVPAADALARLLRALGVRGQDIPPEEDERAAHYRSLLVGKRMLIVLDNARSADQVRPLLPGTAACTVVVTSRDTLAGLVARDGAIRLDLDLLPQGDAVGLLRTLIGAPVDADPGAAAALADQCCRLPLALRVAAEMASSHPGVPLADLTGQLADLHKRLDLLAAGEDRRTALRAVFSWSYHHLGADAARTFCLLGLHPGPDFEPYAVAALTGMAAEHARQMLEILARAHLIHISSPGRYSLHDLLRAYARELSGTCGDEQRHEALNRLFDYYQGTAAAAMDALHPAERHWRPRVAPTAIPPPAVNSPAAAQGWLDAERATLVAVTVHAAEHGWSAHTTQLADTLGRYLSYGSYYPEAIIIHSWAQIAAQQAGDAAAEAAALNALGLVAFHQGRYQLAAGHIQPALTLFRETGDRIGEARALNNLGVVSFLRGRHAQADEWWRQSLTLHHENGDQAGEASLLGNLGLLDLRQGRYQQASDRLQQSLALAQMIGKRTTEIIALVNLGDVSLRQGAYQLAATQLQQALALAREVGDRNHEGSALVRLGEVSLLLGRNEKATDHLQQALVLARETGDREDEAEALNGLGEVLLGSGQPGQARAQHESALELAEQIGGKYQQARAHRGLAHALQATDAPGQARHHWRQALSLYAELGAPEADDIRSRLTAAREDMCPAPPDGRIVKTAEKSYGPL